MRNGTEGMIFMILLAMPMLTLWQVGSIQSRVVRGNEVLYEVQWKGCLFAIADRDRRISEEEFDFKLIIKLFCWHLNSDLLLQTWCPCCAAAGCDDPKQNTFENLAKLKKLDMVGLAKAKGLRTGGLTKLEQVKT